MGQSSNTPGVTKELCSWIYGLSLNDIPEEVRTRAKYLILDGICCALVGAHLPWVEKAARAVFSIEPPGDCMVWGYDKKLGALPAALLNSTEIQSFELDDWHTLAPLHSNSIILPALLAAAGQKRAKTSSSFDGTSLLLSTIIGYEVGPRVGLCLYGGHMLTRGWHSGTVFGHAASAAAVSKLLGLQQDAIEDALGMACTQACGLMSAQFGSDVKRMQHGFPARNGLFAALLAETGYIGIKNVFEEPYGGFLSTFGQSGKEPPYLVDELTKALGQTWQSDDIRVKSYASMAGTHCTVDTIAALQQKHADKLADLQNITSIKIEMSEAAMKHGGWTATRPLSATGAQMSCAYVAAVQLVDRRVSPQEFRHELLDRDVIWDLIDKTECCHTPELGEKYEQRVTVTLKDGEAITETLQAPHDVDPGLTNEEILQKFRTFTDGIMAPERRDRIEKIVLDLETMDDVSILENLLAAPTRSPIDVFWWLRKTIGMFASGAGMRVIDFSVHSIDLPSPNIYSLIHDI
ncbi:immune-responsive protein [Penicillium alfredii]|uniref:Immune-responsive protein n=1 Tax=Penicillium alfredii TaxID=1506179 RepID=A0A9W9FKI6_9EURO|nr:immune-responsive protein [Penicillium alfredii]KAJ5101891.1 immune-responsive protein [Penicillium alfredii]